MALTQSYPSAFWQQFIDDNGKPIANGTVKTYYASDHSLPIQTYTYPGSGIKNPTSIMLDAAGRCTLALETNIAYYIEVYTSENELVGTFDNVTAGGGGGGMSGEFLDDTLHGDGTFENPFGVTIPRVISGLVRNVVGETNNVHTRVKQYLNDGTTVVGVSVDETEYTGGFGINIDDHVIYLDTEADLKIAYLTGKGSTISASDLNTNITENKSRGTKVYIDNNVIKLKPGTYAVNAFVKINNTGLNLNANVYKINIFGSLETDIPTRTVEFDNSFYHEEIYEVTYLTTNNSEDTDVALSITTDARSQLSGANVSLDYIQVYNLNGMIGEGGSSVSITSEDQSVDITESIVHGYKSFDLSVKALPDISEGDEGKILTVDSEGNPAWETHQQEQADWNQTNSSAVDYIKNKPVLATVAHTGEYNDLLNKPTINNVPAVTSEDDEKVLTASYEGGVGSYSWQDAPISLPESTSADEGKVLTVDSTGEAEWANLPAQQQADWDQSNSSAVDYIKNKPQNLVQDASYVHTDNNFTTALKDKLDGIEAGAEVNVQADWSQSNSSADDYIKNKPGNATQSTDGFMSAADKTKLDGIEAGAEVNVQSDWTQVDDTQDDYIKNKPVTYNLTAGTGINMAWNQNDQLVISSDIQAQVQSDWTQSDSSAVDYIKNKPGNATTETAGFMSAYDKSKLNGIEAGAEVNVQADWNQTSSSADDYIKNKPQLAAVATSGSYTDLTNVPEPIQSDWAQTNSAAYDYIKNKPNLAAVATSGSYTDLSNVPNFATVATSGSYNDLSNKPSIPAAQIQSDWTQNAQDAVDYIKHKPTLSTVATTGDYNDLINKPTVSSMIVLTYGTSTWADLQTALTTNSVVFCRDSAGTYCVLSSCTQNYAEFTQVLSLGTSSTSNYHSRVVTVTLSASNSSWSQVTKYLSIEIYAGSNLTSSVVGGQLNLSIPDATFQSDWNQSTNTARDYIKNKPSIPVIGTITL